MPKLTILNKRRVPLYWAGRTFAPGEETTVEVDEATAGRLRHRRGLYLVDSKETKAEKSSAGEPAWGTKVDDALAYVGTDQTRAIEVLEAEKAKGDKARKSLVEKLEPIAAGETVEETDEETGETGDKE